MTFTLINEPYVLERVRAFVPCSNAICHDGIAKWYDDGMDKEQTCSSCQGSGGVWHEEIRLHSTDIGSNRKLRGAYVTKQSFLTRRWSVCSGCSGKRAITTRTGETFEVESWGGYSTHYATKTAHCKHCHKDAYGNPTGASEPISEWEVLND